MMYDINTSTGVISRSERRRVHMQHFPEFGDSYDNSAALAIAVHKLEHGRVQDAIRILVALRKHILRSRDPKSEHALLPAINWNLKTVSLVKKTRRIIDSRLMIATKPS